MSITKPLVTVFTLCYNTGRYVIEALDSVKANNYPNLQHIIIDDFSTDGESVQLVEEWIRQNNYPCTFIKHEENWGINKSLNQVVSLAEGEYMTGISDDLWCNERLEKEVRILEADNEIALLFGNAEIIDENSIVTGRIYSPRDVLSRIDKENRYLEELEKCNYIIPPACIFKTKVIKELGGFDENLSFEDWDIALSILRAGYKVKYVDHLEVKYRSYSTSFWHSASPTLLDSIIKLYKKHSLYQKNDSFVDYINHFKNIAWSDKLRILRSLSIKHQKAISLLLLLCFVRTPVRVQKAVYKTLF